MLSKRYNQVPMKSGAFFMHFLTGLYDCLSLKKAASAA